MGTKDELWPQPEDVDDDHEDHLRVLQGCLSESKFGRGGLLDRPVEPERDTLDALVTFPFRLERDGHPDGVPLPVQPGINREELLENLIDLDERRTLVALEQCDERLKEDADPVVLVFPIKHIEVGLVVYHLVEGISELLTSSAVLERALLSVKHDVVYEILVCFQPASFRVLLFLLALGSGRRHVTNELSYHVLSFVSVRRSPDW